MTVSLVGLIRSAYYNSNESYNLYQCACHKHICIYLFLFENIFGLLFCCCFIVVFSFFFYLFINFWFRGVQGGGILDVPVYNCSMAVQDFLHEIIMYTWTNIVSTCIHAYIEVKVGHKMFTFLHNYTIIVAIKDLVICATGLFTML